MSNNLKYNFLKPKLPMITENHVQYPVLKALSSSVCFTRNSYPFIQTQLSNVPFIWHITSDNAYMHYSGYQANNNVGPNLSAPRYLGSIHCHSPALVVAMGTASHQGRVFTADTTAKNNTSFINDSSQVPSLP